MKMPNDEDLLWLAKLFREADQILFIKGNHAMGMSMDLRKFVANAIDLTREAANEAENEDHQHRKG